MIFVISRGQYGRLEELTKKGVVAGGDKEKDPEGSLYAVMGVPDVILIGKPSLADS